MKKEYRLDTFEFLRLKTLEEKFRKFDYKHPGPLIRFNLGFGIFGVLEQCTTGKYMTYEAHKERIDELEQLCINKEYKHLKFREKVENYLAFKERRIIISTFIIIGLLCLELSRLF